MLDISGYDDEDYETIPTFIREDFIVKLTEPVTVIKEGMAVKLDLNREVVLTGSDASLEDFTWWAFTSANDANDHRSDFELISKVTLVKGPFIADTDQYDANGTYNVGTKLASENGILVDASTGDHVIGRALGMPSSGKLKFITLPLGSTLI